MATQRSSFVFEGGHELGHLVEHRRRVGVLLRDVVDGDGADMAVDVHRHAAAVGCAHGGLLQLSASAAAGAGSTVFITASSGAACSRTGTCLWCGVSATGSRCRAVGQPVDRRADHLPRAVGGRMPLAIAVGQRDVAAAHRVGGLGAHDHAGARRLHDALRPGRPRPARPGPPGGCTARRPGRRRGCPGHAGSGWRCSAAAGRPTARTASPGRGPTDARVERAQPVEHLRHRQVHLAVGMLDEVPGRGVHREGGAGARADDSAEQAFAQGRAVLGQRHRCVAVLQCRGARACRPAAAPGGGRPATAARPPPCRRAGCGPGSRTAPGRPACRRCGRPLPPRRTPRRSGPGRRPPARSAAEHLVIGHQAHRARQPAVDLRLGQRARQRRQHRRPDVEVVGRQPRS